MRINIFNIYNNVIYKKYYFSVTLPVSNCGTTLGLSTL